MQLTHSPSFDTPARSFDDRIRLGRASDVLLWLVLALIVAGFAWAAITRIDRATRAPGRVRTDANTQIVSNLEGGVVAAVYVRPGQKVVKGQPLMKLDPTQSASALDSNQAAVSALTAKADRLQAEVTGHAPAFSGGGEDAKIEQSLHAARVGELSSTLSADQDRVTEAEHAVTEAAAARDSRQAATQSARSQLAMLTPLVAKGIEPQADLLRAQKEAAMADSDLSAATAALARAKASVGEARATLMRDRNQWRSDAATELASTEADLQTRARTLPALSDQLDRTVIRAPRDGRVNRILVDTVGGTVRAGEPIIEIVPNDGGLVIEAMVRPQDIAHVAIGQRANVNITAYDPAVYGSMPGHVVAIAPDAQTDEHSGQSYYLVRVRTDQPALLARDGRRLPIGAGMVAEVNVLGEKRSILSYLLTPITRLSDNALRE